MINEELYQQCLEDALKESKLGFESLPPGWLRRQLIKRNMYYKEQVKGLQSEIEALRIQIGLRQKQIDEIYFSCQHNWTEPKLVVQKVDYDCGSYGGSYNSRKWERECTSCGKIETTYREALMSVPDFGNDDGKITVSLFGG